MTTADHMAATTLQRRLERIKNRRTLYELAITHPDGQRYLVAYCGQKNRRGMWSAVTGRSAELVRLTGDESIHFGKLVADGATMGAWAVNFSSRTQRDCYLEGELPWVGSLYPETKTA